MTPKCAIGLWYRPARREVLVTVIRSAVFAALLSAFCCNQALAMFDPWQPNEVTFEPAQARFIRLVILKSSGGSPCIDELEIYGPETKGNLALASSSAKASASSLLPGYAIHQVAHLNDGRYGNSHSWIAATTSKEWVQIELPRIQSVAKVVFSRDREGQFADRIPAAIEVRLSEDGHNWRTVAAVRDTAVLPEGPLSEETLLRYSYACEDESWRKLDKDDPLERILRLMQEMADRFAARGFDVHKERAELENLQRLERKLPSGSSDRTLREELSFQAHLAKRRLMLREPELAPLTRVLFVKRQPYEPSHNYSDIFDPQGAPGGGVCTLEIPWANGSLEPAQARLTTLFDSRGGVARDQTLSFDGRTIWFGYRPTKHDYFHIWRMNSDGTDARQITEGPFHDYFPCPLPDGALSFISTRCRARFLCWRPQAFVLFRMQPDGSDILPLSFANISEWTPSVMRDGRILWMRSEYLDKGANFGHTLWAIRPDGSQPELIFGNNTDNCYANGREIPGTSEIICTLVSHGGDLNGPIALIDPLLGRSNPKAIRSLTPDVAPRYDMDWARDHCFRDPFPISRDFYLCSHAPADKFGLYLLDRWGNRELLYLDPEMGCMSPIPLKDSLPPPILSQEITESESQTETGQFLLVDIYRGLEPKVKRGAVKFIRVCQEVRADLLRLSNGEYQQDHEPFMDWYATPVHKVSGTNGWPSYVAKADLGLVPVESDGSANFTAPAGKVLYFQALDGDFNELQRMRSVVQLHPGEKRGCIGCHEDRMSAPPNAFAAPIAMRRPPSQLEPPPWGAGPFTYEKIVQPVWDAKCIRCHDAKDKQGIDLAGTLDADGIPASYRTLIERGWVHYFDWGYAKRHRLAEPLTFGTVQSPLWRVLETDHYNSALTREEMRRVKTWIDLNCPLWPDYRFRLTRPGVISASASP